MKKVFFIILGLFCAIMLSAQTDKTKCKIELKDGSVLIGYVAQQSDGSYVVESESGDIFYYTANEIRRIIELGKDNVQIERSQSGMLYVGKKEKKYHGMVSGGVGISNDPWGGEKELIISAHYIFSYRFSPSFSLGLGVGVEYDDTRFFSIPVYANVLYKFSNKRVSPYISLGFGGQLPIEDLIFGPFLDATIGLSFKNESGKPLGVGLSIGYCDADWGTSIPVQLKVAFGF